jgi:hypothetical protein
MVVWKLEGPRSRAATIDEYSEPQRKRRRSGLALYILLCENLAGLSTATLLKLSELEVFTGVRESQNRVWEVK